MTTPTPQSKAHMDANFERRLREHQRAADAEYQARQRGEQVRWVRPAGWDGNLYDVESLSVPYARTQANQEYLAAVSDPNSPGTTGDVVATTTMIDYLAAMERAHRVRHLRRPRAMALMLGRKRGQGSERGPFVQCGLEYLRSVLRQAGVPQS